MTVLFVSYSGALGGAERLLLDAAGAVAPHAALTCPEGPLAEAAREAAIPTFVAPARSLELRRSARDRAGHAARLALHGREAVALARDLDASVVLAWGMRSLLSVAGALPRRRARPALVFAHNDLLPGPAIAAAVRAAARRADLIVALSETVAEDLDLAGGLDVAVIHPGVDLATFTPADPEVPPSILLLGALEPWKRPDLALDATAALVASERPELRLVIAGEPIGSQGARLMAALRERARAPDLVGRVELAGRLKDPRAALARSAVLIHCADREPFGIAMIEALASGIPVVAPASGGPTEIVTKDVGRLFLPGDAASAARGIAECLERPAMRGAARARAEAAFDVQVTRARWRSMLGGLRTAASPPLPASARGPAASSSPAPGACAFVTVTHNSAGDLARLLASAARQLDRAAGRPEVVVVDAGSDDGPRAVATDFGAQFVALDNVGYGAAANRGVARVHAEVCVVLNPDIELVDASLLHLATEAAGHPDRIFVPLVLLPDGTRQDVAQNGPAGFSDLAIALGPPAAIPAPVRVRVQPWRSHAATRADWAVAACLVARTDTLRRLGPFDPEIFLFAEDLDLGLRARAVGVETWFWPDARVIHHRSHSTVRAFGGEPFARLARQRRRVIARRLGEGVARRDDLLQSLTFTNRLALKRLLRRPVDREREQLAAVREAKKPA